MISWFRESRAGVWSFMSWLPLPSKLFILPKVSKDTSLEILSNILPDFELPKQLSECRGIYIFKLRLPSYGRLTEGDERNVELLRKRLSQRLASYSSVILEGELSGTVSDGRGSHIRRTLNVVASEMLFDMTTLLASLAEGVLGRNGRSTYELFNFMTNQLPPLYVGMAFDQSLNERLLQHIELKTSFSEKMRKFDLGWSESSIDVVIYNESNKIELRNWEKVVQSTLRPVFSFT